MLQTNVLDHMPRGRLFYLLFYFCGAEMSRSAERGASLCADLNRKDVLNVFYKIEKVPEGRLPMILLYLPRHHIIWRFFNEELSL